MTSESSFCFVLNLNYWMPKWANSQRSCLLYQYCPFGDLFCFPLDLHKYKKYFILKRRAMKKTQVSWVWSLPWDSFCLSWLPLPIKWWQYLKPSSKAVLQKKHWHKSSGKGSASASWVLFCAFTHCLLSGAAYCHIWGKELWLRTRRETYAVPVNAPALLPSVRLEGTWSHPAVPRLLWKKINVSSCAQVTLEGGNGVQLCPAHPTPRCHQGCTQFCKGVRREFTSFLSPSAYSSWATSGLPRKQQQQPEYFVLWFSHPC